MAFYQKNYGDTDGESLDSSSKFNEAFLKMHRIHKLQDQINFSSMDLLAFNEIMGLYNYQIVIANCSSIIEECWGKMNDEEKTNSENIRLAIKKFLKDNPIHTSINNNTNHKNKVAFNSSNYDLLEEWIIKYKHLSRELLGRTGYDSPNKEMFGEDEL